MISTMITRDNIRDTASTLAHLWIGADHRDQCGVERVIRSHPVEVRPVLCAHIMRYLELRGFYTRAAKFESMLFDMADVPDDGTSDLKGLREDVIPADHT